MNLNTLEYNEIKVANIIANNEDVYNEFLGLIYGKKTDRSDKICSSQALQKVYKYIMNNANLKDKYSKTQLSVYVCSPLKGIDGDYENNTLYTKSCALRVMEENNIPIVPHLLFPQFLDDTIFEERKLGMDMGTKLLLLCDMVAVFLQRGVSDGMKAEIEVAKKMGMLIKYYDSDNKEFYNDVSNSVLRKYVFKKIFDKESRCG